MKRVLLFGVLFFSSCGVYRHAPAPYQPPITRTGTSGRTAYARDCAWCHGSTGAGTTRGPSLKTGTNGPALTDFMLRTGRMPLGDPHERMRHRPAVHDNKQIDAITAYVATLGGRGPKIPHVKSGNLTKGADLYLTNCAACHSTTGIGGALAQGRVPGVANRQTGSVAPPLQFASPQEVAEAIRTGPGSMPAFERGVLSDHEVDSIVRYVSYLKQPKDRGGASTGHIGPVAEGAVGWILGLGLLLAFSRWIGSRESR